MTATKSVVYWWTPVIHSLSDGTNSASIRASRDKRTLSHSHTHRRTMSCTLPVCGHCKTVSKNSKQPCFTL
eukprot:1656271-Amphidinium_carterae.1